MNAFLIYIMTKVYDINVQYYDVSNGVTYKMTWCCLLNIGDEVVILDEVMPSYYIVVVLRK